MTQYIENTYNLIYFLNEIVIISYYHWLSNLIVFYNIEKIYLIIN